MHVLESDTGDALGGYKFVGTLDTESWAMYEILFKHTFDLNSLLTKFICIYFTKRLVLEIKIFFMDLLFKCRYSQNTSTYPCIESKMILFYYESQVIIIIE
jgi:hypothetical protein